MSEDKEHREDSSDDHKQGAHNRQGSFTRKQGQEPQFGLRLRGFVRLTVVARYAFELVEGVIAPTRPSPPWRWGPPIWL